MHTDTTLLTRATAHRTVHICQNDMLYLTWGHVTIRLNVAGLIYLVRYLNDTLPGKHTISCFEIIGNPDDGYQLWVQDAGLRLSFGDYQEFKQLLDDSLSKLKQRGQATTLPELPTDLAFAVEAATVPGSFSIN